MCAIVRQAIDDNTTDRDAQAAVQATKPVHVKSLKQIEYREVASPPQRGVLVNGSQDGRLVPVFQGKLQSQSWEASHNFDQVAAPA